MALRKKLESQNSKLGVGVLYLPKVLHPLVDTPYVVYQLALADAMGRKLKEDENPVTFASNVLSDLADADEIDEPSDSNVPPLVSKISEVYESEWKESPLLAKHSMASAIVQNGLQLARLVPFVRDTKTWISALYDLVRTRPPMFIPLFLLTYFVIF